MATYSCFEDLPVWQAAIELGRRVFKLTEHASFKYKGDLVNQLRRASLSVSNNIAEGFERGTTAELVTFLYIARGSCGEVRSMLRFAIALGAMRDCEPEILGLIETATSINRQIRGWADSLQNSDIKGQRYLNDNTRAGYERDARTSQFLDRLRVDHEQRIADLAASRAANPNPNAKSKAQI